MNGPAIEAAKREAGEARRRLDSTMAELQQRLHPKSLASEAWDGVKDKSSDLADSALDTVKRRPGAVSVAVGAVVLFLARDPLKRAVGRWFGKDEEEADDGRVTTRIDTASENYNPAAPLVEASPHEGAIS